MPNFQQQNNRHTKKQENTAHLKEENYVADTIPQETVGLRHTKERL